MYLSPPFLSFSLSLSQLLFSTISDKHAVGSTVAPPTDYSTRSRNSRRTGCRTPLLPPTGRSSWYSHNLFASRSATRSTKITQLLFGLLNRGGASLRRSLARITQPQRVSGLLNRGCWHFSKIRVWMTRPWLFALQGYLAHKKPRPLRTVQ